MDSVLIVDFFPFLLKYLTPITITNCECQLCLSILICILVVLFAFYNFPFALDEIHFSNLLNGSCFIVLDASIISGNMPDIHLAILIICTLQKDLCALHSMS